MTHTFDKSKLPSRHVSVGPERAPHRSYYYAMGLTEEEIARPFVARRLARVRAALARTTHDRVAAAAALAWYRAVGGYDTVVNELAAIAETP